MDKTHTSQEGNLTIDGEGLGSSVPNPARILVVDDDPFTRKKLSFAIRNLGHVPETAENGEKGLERLREGGISLVLLDIEMPVMDGFEMLTRMNADPNLKDVRTLVISGLDEIAEIAKAIELGAVDFLPKNFDIVILRARVSACLERSRSRERERQAIFQIEQLTKAADALDSDDLNPMELEIRAIAAQPGPIGNLSRVLLNKSTMVYNRRQIQAQQIRNLNGILMLLVMGASFGLKPALARLHLADVHNPISVGLYTMGLSTLFLICFAVSQKARWPKPSWNTGKFLLILAIATLLPQVLLFWVATEVPGVIIALLVTLESFIVFFVAAVIGLEKISMRRFLGLSLGISGVLTLLLPQMYASSGGVAFGWLMLAMAIPACFAGESIFLSLSKSVEMDLVAVIALVFVLSTAILTLAIIVAGSFVPLQFPPGRFEVTVVAFSIADTIGMITLVKLISYAGPVFTSQKAYTVATGGVIWSVLLLHESFTLSISIAFFLILAGLYFVAKKPVAESLLKRARG